MLPSVVKMTKTIIDLLVSTKGFYSVKFTFSILGGSKTILPQDMNLNS